MQRTDRRYYGAAIGLLIISAIVRILVSPTVVSDYTYFTAKWFDTLASHPWLTAFQYPFSDYAPLYLYGIKLLTFLPLSSLYSIKLLSILGDIAIALCTNVLLAKAAPQYTRAQRWFASAIMFAIPTLIINSSLWGQSDALYAAAVLASFLAILLDAPLWAAIAFGVALSFKIQAIFFLPILAGYLLRIPKTWWYLLVPPLLFAVSILPAWLGGGSFASLFTIYAHQASEYPWLNVSSQSFFAFVNNLPLSALVQREFFWAGIILAGVVALGIATAAYASRAPQRLTLLALLSTTLIPFLLPRMHERYFFLGDVFAVVYALLVPRAWYLPVLIICTSFLAYMPFLSPQVALFHPFHIDLRVPATLLGITLLLLLYRWFFASSVRKLQA